MFADIDECVNRTVCPSGICINVPGSYNCGTCPNGFLAQGGQCVGRSSTPCEREQAYVFATLLQSMCSFNLKLLYS